MVVNGRPLKRMKGRVTADLYDFLAFPFEGDELSGPFRTNVRAFLSKHARLPPPSSLFSPSAFPHLLTWQIVFRVGDPSEGGSDLSPPSVVALDVVEEEVTRSRSVYCDQCRVVGWSGHPVCGKRYHFIIRADNKSIDGYQHACTRCRATLLSSDSRCRTCNNEMTTDDAEDLVYLQLEDSTHLLHGVIHANGYGHLLRVNGREGGSKLLSGREIMDFWDRICNTLRVRKVTVMDVSRKYGMEFRLLHAITNGHTWYGKWGYEFGAGSFALTLDAYRTAVKDLSDIALAPFFNHGRASRRTRTRLQDVVAFYWSLSGHRLLTVRDLFCFIVDLLRDYRKQAKGSKKSGGRFEIPLCLWSDDDVKRVESAMIKVLRAVGNSRWVPWRSLRGAAFRVGPPQLLDYCLKELGGRVVDNMVIDVRRNPETHMVEYRLCCGDEVCPEPMSGMSPKQDHPCDGQLVRDLRFLYDALLNPQTMQDSGPNLTREVAYKSAVRLIDCKQFVKEYCDKPADCTSKPGMIYAICQVELIDQPKDYTAPPPELVVLPEIATVGDLKREASRAFQEVYVIFKRFQAEDLMDYGQIEDSTNVKFLVGSGGLVRVRGRCHSNHGLYRFRMERGTETWTVDCICGAKDDDGERMMACDKCGVWQHTRCAGISDIEAVPMKFVCVKCGGAPLPSVIGAAAAAAEASAQRCRDENAATGKNGGLSTLAAATPFTVG